VEELAGYEHRLRRAGLPLLIEDYSASEDIFTRAAPLLGLVFVGETVGAIDRDWSTGANVAALVGGLAVLVVAFGVLNRLRGRRFLALPEQVGRPELAAFVLIPAALPAIFNGQTTSALVTALANLALLALVYAVVGYGLLSIVRWALARLFGQLAASFTLLTRAVPLLLVFALVLFVNTEMWQVFSDVPRAFLAPVFGLFVGLGSLFLAARLPREVDELERDVGEGPPLDRRQRINVALVMFVAQALQVLVVCVAVAGFFVAFGALTIGAEVRDSWIGSGGNELVTIALGDERVQITEELLRVSGAIAAFSGLYYAIAVLTDTTYREEFRSELTAEMRDTFRLRAEYLARRASATAP
jgi:MFS family permease